MINLLPPEARKHVLTEYWLRVISVWFLLVVGAGVLVMTLLFPSYILITLQLQARADSYQQVAVEHQSFAEAQTSIRNTNTNMRLLDDAASLQHMDEVLEMIRTIQSPAVFIERVSMERSGGYISGVTINGEAETRDALATFQNQLEAASMFQSANLPLENLARDREVPFQIEVVLVNEDTEL